MAMANKIRDMFFDGMETSKCAFRYRQNGEIKERSRGEFLEDVMKAGAYLYSRGLHKKHIAIAAASDYPTIVYLIAILCTDNVVVCVCPDTTEDKMEFLLDKADVDFVITDKAYRVIIPKRWNEKTITNDEFHEVDGKYKDEFFEVCVEDEEDALIIFTSGSTGVPKCPVFSNRALLASADHYDQIMKVSEGELFLNQPVFHMYGVVYSLIRCRYHKTIFINTNKKYFKKNIMERKPNALSIVPAQFGYLAESFDKKEDCFIKYVSYSAASMDKKMLNRAAELGIAVMSTYAMTEAGTITEVPAESMKVGVFGKPIGGMELKLSETGEILVKAGSMFSRYYKQPEETSRVFDEDGYFHTHDCAFFDENNLLHFCGRTDNMIVLSEGENIYPEEIEKEILKINGIKECIVYANKDMLVARMVVSQSEDTKVIKQELDRLNGRLPSFKRIVKTCFTTEELEKGSTGKIKRIVYD